MSGISYWEARAYARFRAARLPSDDEWERAALVEPSGKKRVYPWGDAFDARAGGFPEEGTVEVWRECKDKSPWGCLFMGGNVHEWCAAADGRGALRGGSARLPVPEHARGTRRFLPDPLFRGQGTGVRLAKDAPP